jgi:hypothetical protein
MLREKENHGGIPIQTLDMFERQVRPHIEEIPLPKKRQTDNVLFQVGQIITHKRFGDQISFEIDRI